MQCVFARAIGDYGGYTDKNGKGDLGRVERGKGREGQGGDRGRGRVGRAEHRFAQENRNPDSCPPVPTAYKFIPLLPTIKLLETRPSVYICYQAFGVLSLCGRNVEGTPPSGAAMTSMMSSKRETRGRDDMEFGNVP